MTAAKPTPTPGPWTFEPEDYSINRVRSAFGLIAEVVGDSAEAELNAVLIADAGTIHHETGLTPSQIKEQRGELLMALQAQVEMSTMLMLRLGFSAEDIADFTSQARAAMAKAVTP